MRAPSGRRLPVGAERVRGGFDFRVWAPRRTKVELVHAGSSGELSAVAMEPEPGGYFRAFVRLDERERYGFRLDGGREVYPDPASRFQPEGPERLSALVDPGTFPWSDAAWRGVELPGQVIYELHAGTFTPEGTWRAAAAELAELKSVGVTVVELMPVAEFPGRFGWGYDGVLLFAPTHLYGGPDDLRAFVDRAHALGLGVILDVVYNHLGPSKSYLGEFSSDYLSARHATEWGAALNFDGPGAAGVREFVTANALHWIREYHLDGLRLDATQDIHDDSDPHIVAVLRRAVREAAGGRSTLVIAENEPCDTRMLRPPSQRGPGLDAIWNDDFHHAAHVALTGRTEAYYSDYSGSPQELLSALLRGPLYQGQYYSWQKKRRGFPALDVPRHALVTYLENHDQVANSARGERLARLASPARHRAIVALHLLGPATPMIFQGEEFAASAPFLFFADHERGVRDAVREGRKAFLRQFPAIETPEVAAQLDDPADPSTFARCKLDLSERASHAGVYQLYRDLLALRRTDSVFSRLHSCEALASVVAPTGAALRYRAGGGDDRLILTNLGADVPALRTAEPILAPPEGRRWEKLFSSEAPAYGGSGSAGVEEDGRFRLPAESTHVLKAVRL